MTRPVTTARLDGQVAIVTGAARNLGAAIAVRLASDGAAVVVNHRGDSTRADAEAVVARIAADGGTALRWQADVSSEAAVEEMVSGVEKQLGRARLLVNNAATRVSSVSDWNADGPEAWEQVLRTNVTGVYLCTRAVASGNDGGAVVNVGSITALIGRTGNLPYVASKSALVGMTRSLARELGPSGVRVNGVVVGAIKTDDERVYGSEEEVDADVLAHQALQFRGTPPQLAAVVAFLLSAEAAFITGQMLTVDGGWVMS